MLRVRITVSFLLLTVFLVVVANVMIGHYKDDRAIAIDREIESSHRSYARLKGLRDLNMRDVAQQIASSDIAAVLSVLATYRTTMNTVEKELAARFDRVRKPSEEEEVLQQRMSYVRTKADFLKEFTSALALKVEFMRGRGAWKKESKAQFVARYQKLLTRCLAVNVAYCAHQLTYAPLVSSVTDLRRKLPIDARPDMVIVADSRLTGVADADVPKYSDDSGFGEQYPVVRAVKRRLLYARDVVKKTRWNSEAAYFVTAHRISDDGQNFVGAVLVGFEINKQLVKGESRILGRDVTYLNVRDRQVVRSTLAGPEISVVRRLIRDEWRQQKPTKAGKASSLFLRGSSEVRGLLIPLSGNYSNQSVAVVLSANLKTALSGINSLQDWIPIGGIIFFLIGLSGLLWSVQSHISAFEDVDSGIHEVISGNHDHVFEFEYRDERLASMAQSLNLMVGLLVGREMDESDESDTSWMESFLADEALSLEPTETTSPVASEEAPRKTAVPAPVVVETKPEDLQLAAEPAESYYRSLYSEFVEARQAGGGETISYVRFVEKVVRQERVLRTQLGCRMVRFRVVQKGGAPALLPVRID